ncbi:MAG: peptidase, partial [Acidobacteria bacterium]
MSLRRLFLAFALLCLAPSAFAQADQPQTDKPQAPEKTPSIADKTKGMQKIDGFVPLYWQPSAGKLFMEIARWNEEILYLASLPAGLGSNPVGLDRNQYGETSIVYFDRVGPKVLMMQPN